MFKQKKPRFKVGQKVLVPIREYSSEYVTAIVVGYNSDSKQYLVKMNEPRYEKILESTRNDGFHGYTSTYKKGKKIDDASYYKFYEGSIFYCEDES